MDYTQPDPPASGEQPEADSTPGYQPPPAGGPPPSQQPYQPPGGFQAAPPPPPPKKGFNWLACCGISCVVILIVGGLVGFCGYRMMQPIFNMGLQMVAVSTRVQDTDLATIKSGAIEVMASELALNPASYEGQWLELTGEIAPPAGFSSSSFSFGDFSSEETTNYELVGGVVVMDVTKAPAVGSTGDKIVAYGQCYTFDMMEMGKMPFVGKAFTESLQNDPALQGQTTYPMLFAKEVTLAAPEPPLEMVEDNSSAGDNTDGASGWTK